MLRFSAFVHGDSANKNGRRDTAVDVAMALVGTLLVSRKCGYASGICRLEDGVKVEGWRGLIVGFFGEVRQIERSTTIYSADTRRTIFIVQRYFDK